MHPLLETMLGKFDLSQEVVLAIENNNKKSYLKGHIVSIREKYLLVSTKTSIVRISPDSIVRIGLPQTGVLKVKKSCAPSPRKDEAPKVTKKPEKESSTSNNKRVDSLNVDKGNLNDTKSKPVNVEHAVPAVTTTVIDAESGKTKKTGNPHDQPDAADERPKDWNPKMLIPKMGDIVELKGEDLTIITNKGDRQIVSRRIIIDKKLNTQITEHVVSKSATIRIPVIWGEVDDEILCLLGISTLESINSRVNTSRDVGNIKMAYALAVLLCRHTSSPTYQRQLQSFHKDGEAVVKIDVMSTSQSRKDVISADRTLTKQGVDAKEAGDFNRAIQLFSESIEKNESTKSTSFRELVNTLIILQKYEEAFKMLSMPGVMDFTSPLLMGRSQKLFNWLTNCLSRIGHEEDVIRVNQIHSETQGITPKQKAACYDRIALAFLRSEIDDKEDRAEEFYNRALEVDPANKQAKEGLASLRPENFDFAEEIIDLEPSSYGEDQLPSVPEDQRSKQNKDLLIKQLRGLRSNSYAERAALHLRLAAVEKSLGHDADMHMDISKYLYNTVLEGRRNSNLSTEAASFLLCESISHWSVYFKHHGRERRMTHYQDCLALYINLFNRQNPTYFFNSPRLITSFENRLYETPEFYQGLTDYLQYRFPFSILVRELWQTSAQSSAIAYLNGRGLAYSIEEGESKFVHGYKTIASEDRAASSELINHFRHMARSENYDELKARLDGEAGQSAIKKEIDKIRLSHFQGVINKLLVRYFHNDDHKYYNFKDCNEAIDSLLNEITTEPTRFSYDGIRTVLMSIRELIRRDYEHYSEVSKPVIDITPSGDCSLSDDSLSFQLNVRNGRGCAAINNFAVRILPSEDMLEHISGMAVEYRSLTGDEEINLPQSIRISSNAANSEVVNIRVIITYNTEGSSEKESVASKDISLHLRNDDIPSNPYSRYSGGKPIEIGGRKMFFGRKDEINNVAEAMMSEEGGKQIIVYGQSRSGKTSFSNMLADELENRGAWCAKFSLQGTYPTSLSAFFAVIMDKIVNILYEENDWKENDFKYAVSNHTAIISEVYERTPEASIATLYTNDLCSLQKAVRSKWSKKLILMIDEFTELYTWIKKGSLPDSIMKIWKAVSEDQRLDYSVVLIGQDTTPLFMREPYASNPFQVIEPRRMSYLPVHDARDMIETPILNRDGKSRFVGKAVDRIIEYTAGSPYYLMIFCNQLVEYMRKKKIGKVTDIDVDEVAKICISNALKGKFDNLYAAVEPPVEEKERSKAILKAIALEMERHKDGASRVDVQSQLHARYGEDEINTVLTDLEAREVVTVRLDIGDKNQDKFSINVKIFQKWLLEN